CASGCGGASLRALRGWVSGIIISGHGITVLRAGAQRRGGGAGRGNGGNQAATFINSVSGHTRAAGVVRRGVPAQIDLAGRNGGSRQGGGSGGGGRKERTGLPRLRI